MNEYLKVELLCYGISFLKTDHKKLLSQKIMSVYIPTHISTTSPLLDISNLLLLPVKRANLSFPTIWNAIFVMYQIIVCIQVPYLTLTLFWNFCWLFLLVYFSLYIFFRIILSNSNKNLTGNFGEGIVSNL